MVAAGSIECFRVWFLLGESKQSSNKHLFNFIFHRTKGKTLDGPPSSPPTDIRVGVINNTAAFVRWSPPPIAMLNGELTGYKVNNLNYPHSTINLGHCAQGIFVCASRN